jgi:hypothetical protein
MIHALVILQVAGLLLWLQRSRQAAARDVLRANHRESASARLINARLWPHIRNANTLERWAAAKLAQAARGFATTNTFEHLVVLLLYRARRRSFHMKGGPR